MLLFLQKSNRVVLGISLAIALLTGIGIYWLSTFNQDIRGYIFIIPPFVILFIVTLGYTITSIIKLGNISKNSVLLQDMSHLESELDDKARLVVNELEQMDFSRLGLVDNPKLDGSKANIPIYIDKQGFTQVHVSLSNGYLRYFSIFEDGHCQNTGLEYKQLTKENASHIREAYVNHQRAVDTIDEKHGDLQLLDTIQAYIAWEQEFGTEYNLKLHRSSSIGYGGISLFLASFLLILASFIVEEFVEIPIFIGQVLGIAPIIIGVAVFILGQRIGFITVTPNNIETQLSKRDAQ